MTSQSQGRLYFVWQIKRYRDYKADKLRDMVRLPVPGPWQAQYLYCGHMSVFEKIRCASPGII